MKTLESALNSTILIFNCDLKMQEMDILEAHILSFFPSAACPWTPERITPAAIMGTAMPGLKLAFF